MISAQISFATLILGLVGCSYGAPVDGDAANPDERALIRSVTAQRGIFGGLGGFGLGGLGFGGLGFGGLGYGGLGYGGLGYGGLGYGGLGYGLGGLGYGGFGFPGLFFDEDPSAESDESQDEAMTSKRDYKTVVIPGHKIRKLKLQVYKKQGEESAVDNASSAIGSATMETMPSASTTNEKIRVIRVPHSAFRRLMHRIRNAAEVTPSAESTDNSESNMENIDVDNSEQEMTKGKGMQVMRLPHHIFNRFASTIPKEMQTVVTDRDLQNVVHGKENSMIRVVNVPHDVYKHMYEKFADE
ncbi:keratin, type I cytoskeletal 10-like [Paramacrobiotus metropolitanus]|uniref:keratin, type I cytoskeletal 10-like n=1 Tax=Paramacrobiotus metropolitanus TaxID=2943436 RepID=UPI00244633FC|nr:keratin, type I cytoskeletal 10-like [Paramacrobiotus metropolitanus]